MSLKSPLSMIFLKSLLKSNETLFLSKMLKASAMTIEGTKIMLSPFPHIENISEAFGLIKGRCLFNKNCLISSASFY